MPYLIRGVDDGRTTKNIAPDVCLAYFRKRGRHGLTVEEGIALIMHRPELVNEGLRLNLIGSVCGIYVPSLWLVNGDQVSLDYNFIEGLEPGWKFPSCAERIAP